MNISIPSHSSALRRFLQIVLLVTAIAFLPLAGHADDVPILVYSVSALRKQVDYEQNSITRTTERLRVYLLVDVIQERYLMMEFYPRQKYIDASNSDEPLSQVIRTETPSPAHNEFLLSLFGPGQQWQQQYSPPSYASSYDTLRGRTRSLTLKLASGVKTFEAAPVLRGIAGLEVAGQPAYRRVEHFPMTLRFSRILTAKANDLVTLNTLERARDNVANYLVSRGYFTDL